MASSFSTGRLARVLVPLVCVLILVASSAVCAWAAASRPTRWTSSVSVIFGPESSDRLLGSSSSSGDVDRILATQAQVVLGDGVMAAASKPLGISQDRLTRATTVENLTDSNVLRITAAAPSASGAATRAQAIADQYVAATKAQARARFNEQDAALDAPVAELRGIITTTLATNPRANPSALNAALTSLIQQQLQLQAAAASETGPAQILSAATVPRSPASIGTATAAVVGAGIGIVLVIGMLMVGFWATRRRTPATRARS